MPLPKEMIQRVRDEGGIAALEERVHALLPPEVLERRLAALEGRRPDAPAVDADHEGRITDLEAGMAAVEAALDEVRATQAEIKKRLNVLEAPVAASVKTVPVREQALPPVVEKPKEKKR